MFVKILKLILILGINGFSTNKSMCRRKAITASTALTTSAISQPVKADEQPKEFPVIEPLSLHFYGAVSDDSCMQLTMALNDLDKKAKHQKVIYPDLNPFISLHIQSGGGALMPTFFVCDTIKNLDTPVFVYVDGFAASAASLMVVSGKKRFMTRNSAMLIHQLTGATSGKFNELKDEMTNLNFFMNKVKNIYLKIQNKFICSG